MNRNKILQSNLLDIIFDNRNKEYGAYVLRKDYEHRLGKALITMLGAVIVFAVWLSLRPLPRENFSVPIAGSFDPVNNPIKPKEPEPPVQKHPQPATKNTEDIVPVITKDTQVLVKIKTVLQDPGPGTPGDQPPGDQHPGQLGGGGGGIDSTNIKPVTPPVALKPAIDKNKPLYSPDIMPEFPGGVQALLKYFKKNLVSPEEITEGDRIQVKVNFIVKYDGTLGGFKVLQSGGEAFDREVLRVLKKMPNWIPGKTSGEEVSVYFTVPVVFTGEQ